MLFSPTTTHSKAINDQATKLLYEVERALRRKPKATIQVHVEVSGPEGEAVYDAAKLLFYYYPRLLSNGSAHGFTDTYDVDQALRVNTAPSRVQNRYFIKLLTRRLGLRPLLGPGWEQGTYYLYKRYSTASSSFGYKKLAAALRELAALPLTKPALIPPAQHPTSANGLYQELLDYFGLNDTAVYFGNFTDQELCLQTQVIAGQPCFELAVPDKVHTFSLDMATYEYLTLCESWDEDDYHHNRLSQTSAHRFQAGAQYEIMLSELLYILG